LRYVDSLARTLPAGLNMIAKQILKESQLREITSRRLATSSPTSVVEF
jgi:hypothetical protein